MRKLTLKDFKEKANEIHNNKYDYSLVDYKNGSTKVSVLCPYHGEFLITPNNHLYRASGCQACAVEARANANRNNFEKRARKIHGNKYDYSKVQYTRLDKKVTIICPEHGEFEQLPSVHFRGNGCKLCSNKKWDTNKFVFEARKVWGDKYDYSKVNYKSYYEPIYVGCPKHGFFSTRPDKHLKSKHAGCNKCHVNFMRLTTEEFIGKARKIHGNKYDYSKSNYVTAKDKVIIICPKHGDFEQKPMNHIELKQGCPSCPVAISKPHQKVFDFLKEIGVENIQYNVRNVLPSGKELDIYLPDFALAIEIDGVWFHSGKFKTDKFYHQNKHKECDVNGIKLFQFWDFEILEKFNIVSNMIKNELKIGMKKIFARKCEVKDISSSDHMNFLNEHHLQGGVGSSFKKGLFYNGILFSVMGISKKGDSYMIDRFASKDSTVVVGGFSKLLKSFNLDGEVISHSANRYSKGLLYENYGFSLKYEHPFTLYYTDGRGLFSRNKYQKHKLKNMIGYSVDKTANEILSENNIYPVWGSGTKTWVLNKPVI